MFWRSSFASRTSARSATSRARSNGWPLQASGAITRPLSAARPGPQCEFDYFLIASGVLFEDARQVIQWARAGTELAALMDPNADSKRRRSIEDAASSWHALTPGMTFLDHARELGWTGTGESVKRAVSDRAIREARKGVTNEEHARRTRAERLPAERRRGRSMCSQTHWWLSSSQLTSDAT